MLAGDTRRFAIRLAFGPDPDEGRGADRDMSLSWGSFQLWVEGRNLCAHMEQGERLANPRSERLASSMTVVALAPSRWSP